MKTYDVSFEKNGVYQSNLVHASNAKVAESWYISTHDGATVLSVREASANSYKPGKPCLTVPDNFENPIVNRMCLNCTRYGKDCEGTICEVWTGCVYRAVSDPLESCTPYTAIDF